jgi:threonine/homoserine/homoserine lactone efflux protein
MAWGTVIAASGPMFENVSPVVAGLGLGIALAGAPGSVQAVLLAEAVQGGVGRGFRALAGANLTFGVMLMCLVFGLSVAAPSGLVLRGLEVGGGVLLVWLAIEGLRSGGVTSSPATASQPRPSSRALTPSQPRTPSQPLTASQSRTASQPLTASRALTPPQGRTAGRRLPPAARGGLAVLLNPGPWLFLGAVASPLFTAATQQGGLPNAVLTALALMLGVGIGDFAVVLLGGVGVRRAGARAERVGQRALAVVLAGVGVWLIVIGARP